MRVRERLDSVLLGVRQNWLWLVITAASVLALGIAICLAIHMCGWESVYAWLKGDDSGGALVRNVGLLIGGTIAIALAVWRSGVAERQADIAQQSLLNERYQQGAEMLGSPVLSVRLGGIYALGRLAAEHPQQYHVQIMKLLCAFVRSPHRGTQLEFNSRSVDGNDAERQIELADVSEVMQVIGHRSDAGIELEEYNCFHLYLREANLRLVEVADSKLARAWLTKADLSDAILPRANLCKARLRRANLSGARLRRANLSHANLLGANLSKAILFKADLSGADLGGVDARSARYREPATGLTQTQLDDACANPANPPHLDGVLDAETGEQLVWRGKPCEG